MVDSKMLLRTFTGFLSAGRKYSRELALSVNESKHVENTDSGAQTLPVPQDPDYFGVEKMFTIKTLFYNRVHYGHKITSLHPCMNKYLFGSRLNHLIFDLNITADHLIRALNFVAHVAYQDGIILFVSRNPSSTLLVEETAKACKEFAVTREWILGTFTNAKFQFKNEIRLPDLCIFLNTKEENGHEHLGIMESAKMLIPTVGIVDSNCNPNLITYPIPGNDDSYCSINLYCTLFKKAILKGKKKRKEDLIAQKKKVENSENSPLTDSLNS